MIQACQSPPRHWQTWLQRHMHVAVRTCDVGKVLAVVLQHAAWGCEVAHELQVALFEVVVPERLHAARHVVLGVTLCACTHPAANKPNHSLSQCLI